MTKKIIFDGRLLTKRELEELALEAARAAQNFDKIWAAQKAA
ncbi:hypothetical protein [Magnetospirillum sulfuroxidans]|nr:hypothetical protein [Magnetospirillum sulfuroxidans]